MRKRMNSSEHEAAVAAASQSTHAANVAARKEATVKTASFDLLLPRLCRTGSGEVFAAGNYVRVSGTFDVGTLRAMRLQGGSIGVHVSDASRDYSETPCGLSLVSATKANEANVYSADNGVRGKKAEHAAHAVTCKFCAARLVKAGLLTAETIAASMPADSKAYALDYGTREVSAELAGIKARADEAAAAVKAAAEKAAREAAKAAKAAAAKREAAKAKRTSTKAAK